MRLIHHSSAHLKTATALLLWVTTCMYANAQLPANQQCTGVAGVGAGFLKINPTAGCTPMKVLTGTGGANVKNVKYIYYYKGGAPVITDAITDSVFTYKTPGTYFVMQLSDDANGKPLRACATITVQDTIAPNFQVKFCSNGTATLVLPTDKTNIYDSYGIDWGDGQSQIVTKGTKNITHKYSQEKTYRVALTGIYSVSKCSGNVAVRAVTATIVKDAPKIAKLEIKNAVTAELVISNPDLLDLLVYSQVENNGFVSTGKIIRRAIDTLKVAIDTSRYMCFKATPLDTCVTKLESNTICTTVLTTTTIDDEKNLVTIIPYRYPSQVKNITVLRDDKVWKTLNPTDIWIIDSEPSCQKPSCYRVKIELQNGLVVTQEKCLKPPLALCGELGNIFVPLAFTPNGDGQNDLLEVKGDITKDYQLTIFNHWNTPVFQSNTPMKSWDGKLNGSPLPTGSYIFLIQVKDKTGRSFIQKGTITLLR